MLHYDPESEEWSCFNCGYTMHQDYEAYIKQEDVSDKLLLPSEKAFFNSLNANQDSSKQNES